MTDSQIVSTLREMLCLDPEDSLIVAVNRLQTNSYYGRQGRPTPAPSPNVMDAVWIQARTIVYHQGSEVGQQFDKDCAECGINVIGRDATASPDGKAHESERR